MVAAVSDHVLTPAGPYSLAQTFGFAPSPSVRRDGARIRLVFRAAGAPAAATVWQRPDGAVVAHIDAADEVAALAELRFAIAVDDDHGPFLAIAADDQLLGATVTGRRGMRPARSSVAQALVHAFAGQLIPGKEAWRIEGRITRRLATVHAGLPLPLSGEELRASSAAEFVRDGLAPQRASALARAARTLDLDRLRRSPTHEAVARLGRERLIGPWSIGIVGLRGLGSYAYGIAGDLGLMRLCGNLLGRTPTVADTQELLARYGDWAGLASLHLVRHPLAHRRSHAA